MAPPHPLAGPPPARRGSGVIQYPDPQDMTATRAPLTAADRKHLPAKVFHGPDKSFPINDVGHAKAAISGATRSKNAGNISPGTAARIQAEARAYLAKHGGGK
jgi:hypothetical protein